MRYRLMATYRGVPYEVGVGPSNAEVVLFAACPPPEELGFEPATGHWRKPVIRAEIDALWESRPVGTYRGEPCMVLDDPGERLHIAYLGSDPERAASLGYWQVDRGVFELLTQRDEVHGLTEERVERPLRWGEQADGTGPVAAYPYGEAPWPVAVPPATAPQSPLDATAPAETAPQASVPLAGPPSDAPLAGIPAADARLADAPRADARPAGAPLAGAPLAGAPLAGAPLADTPIAAALLAEVSATDALRAEVSATDAPLADAATADMPLAGPPPADTPAGTPLAGAAGAPPRGAPMADAQLAGLQPADAPVADVPLIDAPMADAPLASPPPTDTLAADAPAADVPMADALVDGLQPADTPAAALASTPPADAPLASAPPADTLAAGAPPADAPMADALVDGLQPADTPASGAPLAGAPLADAPMADAPLASIPPARIPPEPVAPAAVPVPAAAPARAEDGAQLAAAWPTDVRAETDPYAVPLPAGDALAFPAEAGSQDRPAPPGFYDPADAALAGVAPASDIGGRAARRQRVPTREIFCELADLASIPRAAYALETETDGAMCLLPTPDGFEVFIAADGARHEVRSFADEEAAYFYLFGVLAAEAIRGGSLAPTVSVASPNRDTV